MKIKMGFLKSLTSKGMLGGYFMIGLGVYLVIDGRTEQGMASIGVGFSLLGIRDKDE